MLICPDAAFFSKVKSIQVVIFMHMIPTLHEDFWMFLSDIQDFRPEVQNAVALIQLRSNIDVFIVVVDTHSSLPVGNPACFLSDHYMGVQALSLE